MHVRVVEDNDILIVKKVLQYTAYEIRFAKGPFFNLFSIIFACCNTIWLIMLLFIHFHCGLIRIFHILGYTFASPFSALSDSVDAGPTIHLQVLCGLSLIMIVTPIISVVCFSDSLGCKSHRSIICTQNNWCRSLLTHWLCSWI